MNLYSKRSEKLARFSSATAAQKLSEVKNGLVRIAVACTVSAADEIYEMGGKLVEITGADLRQIAAKFQSHRTQDGVRIDYNHLSNMIVPPGWDKAAGWLKDLDGIEDFMEGGEILWGLAEFTPACLTFIRQKEYKYFSPVIKGVALDGKKIGDAWLASGAMTNRPALKMLPPIEISAAEFPELLEMAALSESKQFSLIREGGKMKNVCHACGQKLPERRGTVIAAEKWDDAVAVCMAEKKCNLATAAVLTGRAHPELWAADRAEQ